MIRLINELKGRSRTRPAQRPARLRVDLGEEPPEYAIYAIGDVHGCLDLLEQAEAAVEADVGRSGVAGLVVLLGDYVDRGAQSAKVLNYLSGPARPGTRRLALCGNHDDMFLKFLQDPRRHKIWLEMGGRETLMSYGIASVHSEARITVEAEAELRLRVPQEHRDFLAAMPVCARIGPYLFAHAGVRPGVPLEEQSDEDLMWIREPFISRGPQLPYLLVHGHTPFKSPSIGPSRIGIDTGAYVSGRLTVLKIHSGNATILPQPK
ncbi:metallophosphoesterase family protein [Rhizobium sp. BE258]|uniref:metallophosphoesterase family protein n=1 Tax=Rhizobium sp. BE258 TaxID=2817722 RepID=UPI0028591025|nr:metallophosphoesterase family protein [Rhizobium sp. BE258]MDR7145211.1 serine/threonine protein phosphatase 1 [Rhizobium sp. BE258]